MEYLQYQQARDVAWRLLLEMGARRLPIQLKEACRCNGLRLISYRQGAELIDLLSLRPSTEGNDGFSIAVGGSNLIFYDHTCSWQQKRLVIAHEIGHYLLGHVRKESEMEDWKRDRLADLFAICLLAPTCVLWGTGVRDAQELAERCGVPLAAAAGWLRYLQMTGREKRLLYSPLERQVFANFLPYIMAERERRNEERGRAAEGGTARG